MPDETTPNEGEVSESTPDVEAADESQSVAPDADAPKATDATEATDAAEGDADAEGEAADAADDDAADESAETDEGPPKPRMSHVRLAMIAGLVLVVALGGLTGWLGYQAYQARQAEDLRNLFLQVGRQGALNLTTINWEQAEADVQRVLDSATGTFYDDFEQRAQPFVEVVKQAQSKSEGEISEAGLESESDTEAQVLVAVTVNTTNVGAPEQQPRSWRMRISVQKTGDDEAKVSNVEFVP